jgi:hypothetical protein
MDNYIPSGKSFAVVSLDHLFLVVIFWMTMLFLTPGVLRRHETHLVVAEEDEDVSFSLSVCLSLSLARVVAKKSKRHATKKRRLRVVVSQPLKKKQSHQIRALCRLKRREKKKKRTRANAFCLFYAQFYM